MALGIQHKRHNSNDVIRSRTGQRFTSSGFKSSWKTVRNEAGAKGITSASFRFHDLKIKAVSDFEGDKQNFSGHKTSSMMEHYNRTPNKVVSITKKLGSKAGEK